MTFSTTFIHICEYVERSIIVNKSAPYRYYHPTDDLCFMNQGHMIALDYCFKKSSSFMSSLINFLPLSKILPNKPSFLSSVYLVFATFTSVGT